MNNVCAHEHDMAWYRVGPDGIYYCVLQRPEEDERSSVFTFWCATSNGFFLYGCLCLLVCIHLSSPESKRSQDIFPGHTHNFHRRQLINIFEMVLSQYCINCFMNVLYTGEIKCLLSLLFCLMIGSFSSFGRRYRFRGKPRANVVENSATYT